VARKADLVATEEKANDLAETTALDRSDQPARKAMNKPSLSFDRSKIAKQNL
jgi:endonuclease/exonuclease/phosphatase (EEP) superfamily protein YafD